MGCQKAIAQQIRDQGADYVLAVKQNQPQLHARLVDTLAYEQSQDFAGCPHDYVKTVGKDHGRIETRRCWAIGAPAYLQYADPDQMWADCRSLVMVECQRRSDHGVTSETRYFVSSLPPHASTLLAAVRGHWSIENSMHWVLDVALREDDSCVRRDQAPQNMVDKGIFWAGIGGDGRSGGPAPCVAGPGAARAPVRGVVRAERPRGGSIAGLAAACC